MIGVKKTSRYILSDKFSLRRSFPRSKELALIKENQKLIIENVLRNLMQVLIYSWYAKSHVNFFLSSFLVDKKLFSTAF